MKIAYIRCIRGPPGIYHESLWVVISAVDTLNDVMEDLSNCGSAAGNMAGLLRIECFAY